MVRVHIYTTFQARFSYGEKIQGITLWWCRTGTPFRLGMDPLDKEADSVRDSIGTHQMISIRD